MEREMYIARDNCGNWCIKAIDKDNGRYYGTKWHGYMHYIGYSKRDAVKAFRQHFNLQGKHFTTYLIDGYNAI